MFFPVQEYILTALRLPKVLIIIRIASYRRSFDLRNNFYFVILF